jgi:hypothetical protein
MHSAGTLNLHHKAVGLSSTRFAVKGALLGWFLFIRNGVRHPMFLQQGPKLFFECPLAIDAITDWRIQRPFRACL